MPRAFVDQSTWYSAFLQSKTIGGSSKAIYSYSCAMHGFAALLSPLELKAIQNSMSYISSFMDKPSKLQTTRSAHFLDLTYSHGAWPISNFGEDIIIGLVDTEILPESPSFSDIGMSEIPYRWKGKCEEGKEFNSSLCNKKLIEARYFSKALLASNPNLTIAMNSPRDNHGHGIFTSSIAAGSHVDGASNFGYASGTARGMAPQARVAMYKPLFFQNLDSLNSLPDVIASIDQASVWPLYKREK